MAITTRQNVARLVAGAVVAAALSLTTGGVAAANHDPRDYWTTTPSPPWSGETSPPAEDGEPTEGATTEPTPSPSETPDPAEPTTSTEPGGGPIQESPASGAAVSEPTTGVLGGDSAEQEAEASSVDPATGVALFTGLAATLLGGGWLATTVARRLRDDDLPPEPGQG